MFESLTKIYIYQRKSDGKCFIGRMHSSAKDLIRLWYYTQGFCMGGAWCISSRFKCVGRLTIKTAIE